MSSQASDDQPACPVDHKAREAWLQAAQAQAASAASQQQARSLQQPTSPLSGACDSSTIDQSPSQHASFLKPKFASSRLSTQRETSTIPRATSQQAAAPTTTSPNAQTDSPATSASGHWIYPSESQFHAALVRKHGASAAPPETTMSAVVPIHNAVNERTWSEILGWEALDRARSSPAPPRKDAEDSPRLVSFSGDAQKLTPRARMLSFMGYTKPFDRHDWVVERASGQRVDYVIDFYSGRGQSSAAAAPASPLSFYLDVRPKLNSYEGARMRFCKFWGLQ